MGWADVSFLLWETPLSCMGGKAGERMLGFTTRTLQESSRILRAQCRGGGEKKQYSARADAEHRCSKPVVVKVIWRRTLEMLVSLSRTLRVWLGLPASGSLSS